MNIFKVLSQGKGRLNEENLSAMLGFLLSPTQTHGLGDTFLREFLNIIAQKCEDKNRFDNVLKSEKPLRADILLESAYSLKNKRRIVDIEIKIYTNTSVANETELTEIHRIAVENKIKLQSTDSEQLKEEFLAILQDIEEGDEPIQVTMIFLTQPGDYKNLKEEYENLNESMLKTHKKAWLRWVEENGDNHIYALLKKILKNESEAEISPINEYVRHTLKAFIIHISENITASLINKRNTGEQGDIIESILVEISNSKYRIERYESSTIRIFNLDTQEYEVTKPLLRKINKEKKLNIDLELSTGRKKNTRNLGRQVMKELVSQGKNLKEI